MVFKLFWDDFQSEKNNFVSGYVLYSKFINSETRTFDIGVWFLEIYVTCKLLSRVSDCKFAFALHPPKQKQDTSKNHLFVSVTIQKRVFLFDNFSISHS